MLDKDSKHADVIALEGYWRRSRHCYGGQAVIHAQGETYLPKLDKQSDTQYASYKSRARFLNATRRTVDGLSGLVFRKDPAYELPAGMDKFEEDVTLNNQSLVDYVQDIVEEKLIVGAGGTLVDHPVTTEGLSVAQAEALNMRPIFTFYPAESIQNWRYRVINNISTLVEVLLVEETSNSKGDAVKQWRYLILDEETGVYYQKLVKDTPEGEELKEQIIEVRMNGAYLNYIPFVFHRTTSKTHYIQPPLTDLVDTNIHHYQVKADHSHGLRYVALPTPYITGVSKPEGEDSEELTLGGQSVWYIDDPDAKVGMLEFTGAGLKAFQEELAKIEEQMAQQGARILSPDDKFVPETATAAILDSKGETSLLAKITNVTTTEVLRCLQIAAEWMRNTKESVEFKLLTDFLPLPMDPQTLTALVGAWQSGSISFETFFENLKKGEIIRSDKTLEQEKDLIESGDPMGSDNSDVLDDGNADTDDLDADE